MTRMSSQSWSPHPPIISFVGLGLDLVFDDLLRFLGTVGIPGSCDEVSIGFGVSSEVELSVVVIEWCLNP